MANSNISNEIVDWYLNEMNFFLGKKENLQSKLCKIQSINYFSHFDIFEVVICVNFEFQFLQLKRCYQHFHLLSLYAFKPRFLDTNTLFIVDNSDKVLFEMCPVYTPEKSPPKLDKFCYLSHPAQRVMIALYQDYIQRKQDLLKCLQPVSPVQQNYYQTLYRSRFGASPTINDKSNQDRHHQENVPNPYKEVASVERTLNFNSVDPPSWIPSDTSTYSDSPPIETQGYRILSQLNQQDFDTSIDTFPDSGDDKPQNSRCLEHGQLEVVTPDVEFTFEETVSDTGSRIDPSQSLFSQDYHETNIESSIPLKAQPRKYTTSHGIKKKCHQMQKRFEKSKSKTHDINSNKSRYFDTDNSLGITFYNAESKACFDSTLSNGNERNLQSFDSVSPTKSGDAVSIPACSISRMDRNNITYSVIDDVEKKQINYNQEVDQYQNSLDQDILDDSFKKMAVEGLVHTDVADDQNNSDELSADMESPFLEKKQELFPIFGGNISKQKDPERRCEEQDQKASDKRKKSTFGNNFAVPFKRPKLTNTNQKESFKEGLLLNTNSLPTDQLNHVLSDILKYEEVIIVLIYKDGSTQLREILFGNEDKKRSSCKGKQSHVEVDGLAVTSRSSQHRQVFTFPVKCLHLDTIREFWDQLLRSNSRKIGFHVKETLATIIKMYKFDHHKVDMCWTILDPVVGQWLLDSDKPVSDFETVLHAVNLPEQVGVKCIDPIVRQWSLDSDKPVSDFETVLHAVNLPEQVPSNDCLDVLYEDMMLLGKAMEKIIQKLKNKDLLDLYLCIETKLVNLLAGMEMRKLHIATHTLIKFSEILKKKLKKLEQKAHQSAGHTFLLNSHAQLRQVLFEELHLDTRLPQTTKLAKTNVGREKSTSETVLTQLSPFHELPGIVLEYRQKLKSTYIDGILSCIKNETLTTHWDQTAAATGRLTSYQPNIQAIPKQPVTISGFQDNYIADKEIDDKVEICARDAFITEQGNSFVSADFQQIELRLLAHLADDPILIQNFTDPSNPDIFITLTAQWLGKPLEEVTSTDREQTKRVVYSVMYGAGKEKLAEYLKITPESAKAIISSFLKKFPSVSQFTKKCVDYCRKNGFTSSIFKRRRNFPNINHQSSWLRAQAERQCVNFCIQGSAADICKAAMIQIENALTTDSNIHAQLLVQIHDELLIEVNDGDVQNVIEIIQNVMQSQEQLCGSMVKLRVPIPVSVSVGNCKLKSQNNIMKAGFPG